MSLKELIEQALQKNPQLKDLTPSELAQEISKDSGGNSKTIRRTIYRWFYQPSEVQGEGRIVVDPATSMRAPNTKRNSCVYNSDTQQYSFSISEENFSVSSEEVSSWVQWYTQTGANLPMRDVCKRIWKKHSRQINEKTLKKAFSLLKVVKSSPPFAPHSYQELGLEGAVDEWRKIAETEIQTRYQAGETKHWKSLYEEERKRGLQFKTVVSDALENFKSLPRIKFEAPLIRQEPLDIEPCIPVLLLSDWHVGMKDLDYNIEALENRVRSLHEEITEWVNVYRRPFEEFHVALGGDMLDGAIELRAGHSFQQDLHGARQIAYAAELLATSLMWISEAVGVPLKVHTVNGNHGRAGKSRNDDPDRLCESICYMFAEKLTPGISWEIHTEVVAKWKIYSTTCFLTHGDLSPKDLKTLMLSHECRPPAVIFSGHHHEFSCLQKGQVFTVSGGSLCGSTSFSRDQLGLPSTPSQVLVEIRKEGPRPAHYLPVKV